MRDASLDDTYRLIGAIITAVYYLGPSLLMTLIATFLFFRGSYIALMIGCLLLAAAVVLGVYNFVFYIGALFEIFR